MFIAISQRNDKNKHGRDSDNLENAYIDYLEKFNINLIVIPNNTKDINNYFEKIPIYGVILTGGNDINPKLYSGEIEEGSSFSDLRDETEKKLLDIAIKKKLHVLGICRGMEFINVYFGGKLVNIEKEYNSDVHPIKKNHTVKFVDEKITSVSGKEIEVNSYHGFGVIKKTLSSHLKEFAVSPDGIVEGIYHPSLPIAGIQWHPERKNSSEKFNEKIIKAFLNKELFWK